MAAENTEKRTPPNKFHVRVGLVSASTALIGLLAASFYMAVLMPVNSNFCSKDVEGKSGRADWRHGCLSDGAISSDPEFTKVCGMRSWIAAGYGLGQEYACPGPQACAPQVADEKATDENQGAEMIGSGLCVFVDAQRRLPEDLCISGDLCGELKTCYKTFQQFQNAGDDAMPTAMSFLGKRRLTSHNGNLVLYFYRKMSLTMVLGAFVFCSIWDVLILNEWHYTAKTLFYVLGWAGLIFFYVKMVGVTMQNLVDVINIVKLPILFIPCFVKVLRLVNLDEAVGPFIKGLRQNQVLVWIILASAATWTLVFFSTSWWALSSWLDRRQVDPRTCQLVSQSLSTTLFLAFFVLNVWSYHFCHNVALVLVTAHLRGWYFEEDQEEANRRFTWKRGVKICFAEMPDYIATHAILSTFLQGLNRKRPNWHRHVMCLLMPFKWPSAIWLCKSQHSMLTRANYGLIAKTILGLPEPECQERAESLIRSRLRVFEWNLCGAAGKMHAIALWPVFVVWVVAFTCLFHRVNIDFPETAYMKDHHILPLLVSILITWSLASWPSVLIIFTSVFEGFYRGAEDTLPQVYTASVLLGMVALLISRFFVGLVTDTMRVVFFCAMLEKDQGGKQARFSNIYRILRRCAERDDGEQYLPDRGHHSDCSESLESSESSEGLVSESDDEKERLQNLRHIQRHLEQNMSWWNATKTEEKRESSCGRSSGTSFASTLGDGCAASPAHSASDRDSPRAGRRAPSRASRMGGHVEIEMALLTHKRRGDSIEGQPMIWRQFTGSTDLPPPDSSMASSSRAAF